MRVRALPRIAHTAVAIALVLRAVAAAAQDVTEPALKAVFIYNFVKFTEWPADVLPPRAPVTICVAGDTEIAGEIERTVRNRRGDDHPIVVSRLPADAQPRGCHVLWVSHVPLKQAVALVAGVRDTPVLTLSDLEGFTAAGGIAFFYFDHAQLRFYVDTAAAKRSRLEISSRLLALSRKP